MSDVSVTPECAEGRGVTLSPALGLRIVGVAILPLAGLLESWRGEGSIASRDWLAYAIVVALAVAVVAAADAAAPPLRLALAAALLAALAAWDALSISWSPSPALARDEALLTMLYALALLLPVLLLRGRRDRVAAAATVLVLLLALAVAAAVDLLGATDGAAYHAGRLEFPVTYTNAQAALSLVSFWPGIALAAMPRLPVVVRALATASAAAALGGWIMVQSKGGAVGIAVSGIAVLTLSRSRLRLLVPLAIAVALAAAAFLPLTEPYRASGNAIVAAIHRAAAAELAVIAVAFAVGLAYALLDRRVLLRPPTERRLAIAVGAAAAAAALCGVAFFLHAHPRPLAYASAKWTEFKHLSAESGTSHLTYLGSNRYDFWRVALTEFRDHPLAGVGARGFRSAYLQHRQSSETPARAHSLELDVLSETGLVGFALLAGALALLLASLARRARSDPVALGAAGALVSWLGHASVDWTWTFPAVGLPLLAFVGIGAARAGAPPLSRRSSLPLAAAAAALAIGAFGLPWLASRYVDSALAGRGDARAELHRARALDPISLDPYLAAWELAPTPRAAIAPLLEALRQEPRSVDLRVRLGREYRLAGEPARARRVLRAALALDPGDPEITAELAAVRRSSRPSSR
jgi:hypothetical protein